MIMLSFCVVLSLLLVALEVSSMQVAVQGCPASRLQSTLGEVDLLKLVLISCVSWQLRFVYQGTFNLLGAIIDEKKRPHSYQLWSFFE